MSSHSEVENIVTLISRDLMRRHICHHCRRKTVEWRNNNRSVSGWEGGGFHGGRGG